MKALQNIAYTTTEPLLTRHIGTDMDDKASGASLSQRSSFSENQITGY